MPYTTGEIARICDVSVRTVQYYDKRGILVPCELSEGGRRLYNDEDLEKMKLVCFLRELDFSLDDIAKIMKENNSKAVISLILDQQKGKLRDEIMEKESKLSKLSDLIRYLDKDELHTVSAIGGVAKIMEQRKKMRRVRTIMIASAIPIEIAEIMSVLLWINNGIWWPFAVYSAVAVAWSIWMSLYYFKRVAFVCPECNEVFEARFKKVFWASHTPTARKLTCPHCGNKNYCVEVYRNPKKENLYE